MRVKVFLFANNNEETIEKRINDWLYHYVAINAHECNIKFIKQSESADNEMNVNTTITIWY